MPNFATVTLIGHLGRDPESKYTPDGTAVVNFSLATTRKRRDSEVTTWWRGAIFGKRAEVFAQYLHKGDPVLIQGEPYLRSYTAKDGSDGVSLEIDVKDWTFVGGKSDRQDSGHSAPRASHSRPDYQTPVDDFDADSELPF